MIKKNKKIITAGCSFTDPNFKSVLEPEIDCSFPKWPEIFNNLCDNKFDLINLGRSGSSNDYILNSAISEILKNPNSVELVIIGLSEISRTSFGEVNTIYSTRFYELIKDVENIDEFFKIKKKSKWNEHVLCQFELTNNKYNIKLILESMLNKIYSFQLFCKAHNINYIIAPMLPQLDLGLREYICYKTGMVNYWTEEEVARALFRSNTYHLIDDSRIIFWPFVPSLGGHDFHSILVEEERLGKIDRHPNAIGHKNIAKHIYDFYSTHL